MGTTGQTSEATAATSPLVFRGADVLRGEGFRKAEVAVVNGTVAAAPAADARVIDVSGCRVVPGYVDLQLNGFGGIDFARQPERMNEVAEMLPRFGVTGFLPTIITSPAEVVDRAITSFGQIAERPSGRGARVLGLHLEGPMLAPARKGAHPTKYLREPSLALIERWSRSNGVALVTLAPELPAALDVVDELRRRGVVVFAGHTAADADGIRTALDHGVSGLTHLFNAMSPLGHRDPGPIGVAFTDERVIAGLICDGIHVDPTVVTIAHRSLGSARLALVSDAVAAAGMPPGRYGLGEGAIVTDGRSVRRDDGTLAGSALTLDAAVRNLIEFSGCPVADAVRSATHTPRAVLGLDASDLLAVGQPADITVLDDQLNVVLTVIDGEIAYDANA